MTREEEIKQAIKDICSCESCKFDKDYCPFCKERNVTIEAINWADQHPRKGLWDGKKVVEWILNNYGTYEQTYTYNSGNHTYSDFQVGQFIRNLREAMED